MTAVRNGSGFAPLLLALVLAACGGSGGAGTTQAPGDNGGSGSGSGSGSGGGDGSGSGGGGAPTAASCDPALASMPASPAAGQSRDGLSCAIHIPSPLNPADTVAFQVFEPATLTGGQKYPLVLEGHGFSGSRQTGAEAFAALRDAGYGVVSIDQAGHGETGGTIRVMDPDQEGRFLLAILDWLEANLDWYMVGPDLDAGEDNMVLGAIGGSYGGGYQYLLHAIDPKKRLDALVPEITWNDLTYSLNPGNVIKSDWAFFLFGAGQTAGGGGNFDPFVNQFFVSGLASNRFDTFASDFFRYHGLGYFCDGLPVATNGGAGTAPGFPPVAPTAVHVLAFQGFRDTLFNFNDAWRNYECLNDAGGDVRLLTYQSGHNTLQVVPDPFALIHQPQGALDMQCGGIEVGVATIAWFDQYLKGIPGAADAVLNNTEVCYSLAPDDAVFADRVIAGRDGTPFAVPATTTVAGSAPVGVPIPLYTAPAGGGVMAGVPRIEITLSEPVPGVIQDPDNVIVFVATGRTRAITPGVWEPADNQVQPLRGLGPHTVDLVGIGERLAPGDQAGLLFYGAHEQFAITGSLNIANPVVGAVTLSGDAWLPLLPAAP